MSEEANGPAPSSAEAPPAGPAPGQKAEANPADNSNAAAARKAFEAEKAKLLADFGEQLKARDAEIAKLAGEFTAEREWRMQQLTARAKAAGVSEVAGKLASEKGPVEFEAVIAEFEAMKAQATEAAKAAPAPQPGGQLGGEESLALDVNRLLPWRNGGNPEPLREAYKKYGQKRVDDYIAQAAGKT